MKFNDRTEKDDNNKIKMDEFHRQIVKPKKHRTISDKKKMRDIQRLLDRKAKMAETNVEKK